MKRRRGVIAVGAALLALAGACCLWIALPLPPGMLALGTDPGLVLLDRNGRELRTTRAEDGSRRRWVPRKYRCWR